MIDKEKREKGSYTNSFKEENITVTETFIIGRDYKILSYMKEYNPPKKFISIAQSVEA